MMIEYEIAMWEHRNNLMSYRKIPEHQRVRGKSRQMSAVMLGTNDTRKKHEDLQKLQALEVARRIDKNARSPNLAPALYSVFSQSCKTKKLTECEIAPEKFDEQIQKDEKLNNHENHPKRSKREGILLPKSKVIAKGVNKKMKSRWRDKSSFVDGFWNYISNNVFTPVDKGVMTYNSVELVPKNMKIKDDVKGWRMVWKTPNQTEKTYDFIKSLHVNTDSLSNDAYCTQRSTQRALTKMYCNEVNDDEGFFGIDYKNAFAQACRSCVNDIVGDQLLNPVIHYSVNVSGKESDLKQSLNGTGAGRATGGPGFNICFDDVLNRLPKKIKDNAAPYADDSQIKVNYKNETMETIINTFKEAEDIGLLMHTEGDKRPTLLVKEKGLDDVINNISERFGDLVKVTKKMTFLGLDHSLDNKSRLTSTLTGKNKKLLSFLAKEMARAMKICDTNSINIHAESDLFKRASQSVASFTESRIQYGILFADLNTIYFYFNVHKKMICTLLGFTPKTFGFRWRTEPDGKYVHNLYDTLSGICSQTYQKLCAIAGKPTLIGMAYRQALVIKMQKDKHADEIHYPNNESILPTRWLRRRRVKFEEKLDNFMDRYELNVETQSHEKPKLNPYFVSYKKIRDKKTRKIYTRLLTDTLFKKHLILRGKKELDTSCRLCGDENSDSLEHYVTHHMTIQIEKPRNQRSVNKYINSEKKAIKEAKRVILDMEPEICEVIAKDITNKNRPFMPKGQTAVELENDRCVTQTPSLTGSTNNNQHTY